MKVKSILAALLLMVAGLQTALAQKVVLHKTNGQTIECDVSELDSITFEQSHEWVDLGLPSGTLWATCNIGANSPEEYGDYFAWGETETKENYAWSTYKYCNGSQYTLTKYCYKGYNGYNDFTDTLTVLQPEDDAATVLWGSEWQMPSKAQIKELYNSDYTSIERIAMNGIDGIKVTSWCNGKSLFLPATGCRFDTDFDVVGSYGLYWSRSLSTFDPVNAYCLSYDPNQFYWDHVGFRCSGRCIRPVRTQKTPPAQPVTEIVLSETSLTLQVDETKTITATVLPDNASNPAVTWNSSKRSVATVDHTGKVTAVGKGFCIITCKATDGSGVKAECTVTIEHEWVDLGLPSGTLWATCNIGADSPEEYGDYFAWGETETKQYYQIYYYKWMNDGKDDSWTQINKYTLDDGQTEGCWYDANGTFIGDGLAELLPEDDAATVNWGYNWQMPSIDQMNELINSDYTTASYTTQNDVKGCLITSNINGNSIFLPAAGENEWNKPEYTGSLGCYWSRSVHPASSRYAYTLYFWGKPTTSRYSTRWYGRPVRPVRVK